MADSEDNSIAVPAGAPAWITTALVEQTIRVWQPYYVHPLTVDDALGIMQAAGRLIEVLSCENPSHETICRPRSGQQS
jgi:hypothetical protein